LIVGFHGTSLVDYPNLVSSVIYLSGCNLHCPYCYNAIIVNNNKKTNVFSEEEIINQLKIRKLFIDAIVITGGEPTLYKDLIPLVNNIKTNVPEIKIKLDTNGLRPEIFSKLVDIIDYVAMDIKDDPYNYFQYFSSNDVSKQVLESINLCRKVKNYEFRTTITKKTFTLQSAIEISKYLNKKDNYYIQNFQYQLNPELLINHGLFDNDNERSFSLSEAKKITKPISDICQIHFRGF